jgi:hypothetical protein
MRWSIHASLLIALVGTSTACHAQAAPRAVLELFTSPNCSSCPPADELFVELARHTDLITLVMPVDYWDRPGREDALAKPAFTERQSAYADVRNEDGIYTPQVVINGAAEAAGSDPAEIDGAIHATAGKLIVPVKAAAVGKNIVVSVGRAAKGVTDGAMITVLPYYASHEHAVGRGENIKYANLVRDIVPLGRWTGKPVKQTIPRQDYAQYDGIVVLLQAGTPDKPGAILGATRIPTRSKS